MQHIYRKKYGREMGVRKWEVILYRIASATQPQAEAACAVFCRPFRAGRSVHALLDANTPQVKLLPETQLVQAEEIRHVAEWCGGTRCRIHLRHPSGEAELRSVRSDGSSTTGSRLVWRLDGHHHNNGAKFGHVTIQPPEILFLFPRSLPL